MKRGDTVVVTVENLNAKGDGVGWVGDRQITLRQTVPGDRVEATLTGRRKGQFEARVQRHIEHGVRRIEPRCSHFGLCGGCRWQDLDYADQLQLKDDMVRRSLAARGVSVGEYRAPLANHSSVFFYRNKMEFSFGLGSAGELQIGLHVRYSYNRIFDLQACYLQSEVSNRVVESVRRHAVAAALTVYDLKSHEGLLRFLVIRESKTEASIMVNLVVSEYPHDGVEAVVRGVLRDVAEIATFIITLHTGKAQVARGEEQHVIAGEGYIAEHWGDLSFRISPQSFFQTNTEQAMVLYRLVCDLAGDLREAQVLDLYCGAGGISLHLARQAAHVYGVELMADAVDDARVNAVRNAVANCTFIAGKAEDVLPDLCADGQHFQLVVVDPPRAGIHKTALAELSRLAAPQMIYVSCNAESMADDLAQLETAGYGVDVVQPVDLFPHTPHCEVVAGLTFRR